VLVAAAAPAGAGELNLLSTSSANLTSGEVGGQSVSLQSFVQSLDVNYNQAVSPLLSYRLRVRASDSETTTSVASNSVSTSTRFIEPAADLTLTGLKYSLNGGVRVRRTYGSGSQVEPLTLTEDQEYIRGFFTPDLLPAFTVQYDRIGTTDDRSPALFDRTLTRGLLGATYVLAQKVNLGYTFMTQTEDNKAAKRTQESRSNTATASYADMFFGDLLSVNGNYLYNRFDTTERFAPVTVAPGGGPVLFPVVLSRAFGLTESDPAVAATSKAPPTSYATLNAGTSTSLGISVPLTVTDGGTPFKNTSIAVGLAPGGTVTTIRLTVSPRAGDPRDITLQAAGVSFQVYATTNPNINDAPWTPIPSSLALPNTLNPYFEITFAATGGTFVKVHVVGDAQQPLLPPLTATAIAAFGTAGGAAVTTGRLTTGTTLQSLTGGITLNPLAALTFGANGTFTTSKQDPSGRIDDTGTYALAATGTPHRLLTITGVYQASFTTSNDFATPRTDTRIAAITLSSTPLPTLSASLSGTRSESELGGVLQSRNTSISFNTALKPYRDLNVDMTSTTSSSENLVDGSKSQTFSAVLNANSKLTDRLTGLFGYTFSTNQVTGGAAPGSVVSNTGFVSLTYTLSRFLNGNARWDFAAAAGAYTLTQQYQLDMIPTPKTSILFSFLRTDQKAAAGEAAPATSGVTGVSSSTSTASLSARWNISRYLDLSATTAVTQRNTGNNSFNVFGTLTFRL
jgi:hypothetical protein